MTLQVVDALGNVVAEIDTAGKITGRETKMVDITGATLFEVTGAGTVKHGKAKVETDATAYGGIILYSPTKKWRLTISDTGQTVLTQIS